MQHGKWRSNETCTRKQRGAFLSGQLVVLSSLSQHCCSNLRIYRSVAKVEKRLALIPINVLHSRARPFGIGHLRRFLRMKLPRDACFAFSNNTTPITPRTTICSAVRERRRGRKVRQLRRNTGRRGRSRFVTSPRRRKRGVRSHD